MKRPDPLDRLLRAAARGPSPGANDPAPAGVMRHALTAWHASRPGHAPATPESNPLPVYRAGLALACGVALATLVLAAALAFPGRPSAASPWTDPTATLARLFSR